MSVVRPPTAATMRLDGGHPALDLVNTVYGQVGGPVEYDVLATPGDLVTFARRVGMAGERTPASREALRAALLLRGALDRTLRAQLDGHPPPAAALAEIEAAARRAATVGRLARSGGALTWTWPDAKAMSPVHRLAIAATELLGDEDELARLHVCDACCWLFVDHSGGTGRRWCSMADCGTEAKKRRYVQRRRARRARALE
ncbi:MAG TPA: ABATE domain-containing protein [Solirubrobacteraceae bacterium]|nr:ABATE domain-containing protein [Solirubrobacteraceae bacterium]